MKRRRNAPLLLLLCGLTLGMLLSACQNGESRDGDAAEAGRYLLTVDGYGVTEEEFLLFLSDQKAVTANYFWTEYQVQPDADFWTTEVGGETPIGYARQRALDALSRSKAEFILAAERGILPYKDYDALMADMATENSGRAEKAEKGEVYYGVTEFTPFTYYQYLSSNIRSELEYAQRELVKPTEAELRRVYGENLDSFDLGVVYEYDVEYPDGRHETVLQSDREIGKEDYTTEDLLVRFDAMAVGETLRSYSYHGDAADITYRGRTHQGYVSFEDAADSLKAICAREELSALIESRVAAAEVVILDQARFDALEMP